MDIDVKMPDLDFFDEQARKVPGIVEKALDAGAERAIQFKAQEIGTTYREPIRKLKNGKDAWRRTGDWASQQTIERSPGVRVIGTRGSAEKYEGRLANLPTDPDGKNRTNDAAGKVLEKHGDQLDAVIQQEIANGLDLD